MKLSGMPARRHVLMGGAALLGVAATSAHASSPKDRGPDHITVTPDGTLQIFALTDAAFRVRFVPKDGPRDGPGLGSLAAPDTLILPQRRRPKVRQKTSGERIRLQLPAIACEIDAAGPRFYDRDGNLLLNETPGGRRLTPSKLGDEDVFIAEQAFDSPPGEHIYGTGCFQDGALDLRHLPRRLTQVNTQISLPVILSSRGYGLLWLNGGKSDLNPLSRQVRLSRVEVDAQGQVVNVTTGAGNATIARTEAVFEQEFELDTAGRFAFQLDTGRKMASRHYVEIDGKVYSDLTNLWLPPTTSFLANLDAGRHKVRVIANADDTPSLAFGAVRDQTVWRSDVAQAIDYVVIAGPDAEQIMATYRQLTGETPLMPKWAYGYIHCRERFKSSQEILDNAREFRRRKLPVDVMVQDWQYWGKHGWNAMRFDEDHYPDPAGLVKDLHGMDMRLMLSVWSKVDRKAELGQAMAARGFYIPDSDWIDFFNPQASAFYWQNQSTRLAALGIDAWWQDATEPENDDLVGRQTHVGKGEHVRLTYPLQVSRTVFDGQRRDYPDRRVFTLTRSAFLGQQQYAAATWSGDIGNDWETLKRQIPAGLNMAAAGYPYWTVDAGGFFRPGPSQYTDTAYHERFIRWFQYATFLPLQRVHGYMTDTEFWRYGETVEGVARDYLNLRYRLFPYIYSLAAVAHRQGMPLIRPLVFDFRTDTQALDQKHSYMFGPGLLVAPVLEPGATQWPVYLPPSPGGWYDLWSGAHRSGGETHQVPSPLAQIPVHVRAGTVLPLGPTVQSTAEITGQVLDILVFPGRDGTFALYEDDGLTYGYESGACSTIPINWKDSSRELTIGARAGRFDGMPDRRHFRLHLVSPDQPPLDVSEGVEIIYTGRRTTITL
ncbi:alpha-xylosidase [Asticcacaulis biprosthecium C19]|uniref:Alpha-xylosidase n=1 Tax=Asticcacaulis biprosthecium C19 TaxID=715226 RepID=F4QTD7_9CAUL|nr:TIM-barrel domain-containing protein [Asticcacaulis biprosthecium]EGF90007.1 alpha-xylosidase [Asticcacaulis biprosthecium C19]